MAQHDYNIANQTGANFRADLNNALNAIATNNSGDNEPSTTFAYEWWIDTTNDVLKLRNTSNNAWITMPFSITADNTVDINAGTVNGITSLSFSSGSTVTAILDEDNLSSNSATALATQQSIKAYVDSQVTAQDLDISDGSSTISIDLDSETLSLLGGTGVTSAASGNGVTFSIGQSVGTSDNVVFNQVTGALVGNASTATALATARNISGVSFDGTANITLDTDNIGEGSSNLYFTNARVDSRFDTRLATKTTDNLTEGSSNKYFTNERVDDQVNTLLTAGANISLTYDDAAGTLTIANTNSADITSVVAGDGLTGGGTSGDVTLAVGVDDSSIEINSDSLRVKASGITNAMLAGSIANAKLTNSSITVNSQAIALGGSHTFDTDDIGEGSTNLYFTNERTDDRVASLIQNGTGISFTYDDTAGTLTPVITLSPFDTDNLSEGSSNLYYTDTRANSAIDARVTNTFINNLSGVVADTATALATGRTIGLSGDVTATGVSFDGTGNITLSTTIAANSVALGTDTTGNYVSTIAGTTNEIEVSGSGSETATVTIGLPDDVTIAGNLTVNGTTTTVNSDTLSVTDPLIKLAKANSGADSLDIGFYGLYDTSGSQDLYAGLFRDANDSGKFKLFKDLQVEPTTTVNTSGTGYAVGTLVSNLEGNVTGNVTGQVSTLSNHDTDNLSEGSSNLYFTNARSRSAISASGDISYNSSTGVISFTQSASPVTSVNSATGAVVLDTDDIAEGSSNLYFTNARADTRINLQTGANLDLSSKSTSNLSEGTNLYYTDARFDTRLGTKTTDNLTEGSSNLYMTTERVQDIVGGMVTGNTETGITVTYDDSDGTLDFVVGTLNQDTTGNAATATALETARAIALSGDVVGTANFDGTAGISISTTIQANSVVLGTDTVGDYVSTITGGTGITSTGATSGEGVAHSLSVDAAQTQITSVGTLSDLTVTGEITANGGIALGDSDKATFGVGDDLQIFHTGSSSVIADAGTGDLKIRANDLIIQSYSLEHNYIQADEGGEVRLYHNNSEKFNTSSSGVTVTGTLTATTLAGTLSTAAQTNITSVGTLTTFRSTGIDDNADALAITIDSSERVGIGITNPQQKLVVSDGGGYGFEFAPNLSSVNHILSYDRSADAYRDFKISANQIIFGYGQAASNEAMRIDSSGNVGIACTDQSNLLTVDANSASAGTDSISVRNRGVSSAGHTAGLRFQFNSAVPAAIRSKLTNTSNGAGTLSFLTSSDGTSGNLSERMRIGSGGDIFFGTTSSPNGTSVGGSAFITDSAGRMNLFIATTTTGAADIANFFNGNGLVGRILTSGSSTTYQTSSDYRLKENVNYEFNGLERLKKLKPARFNFKADVDTTVDGFLAHEVQEIVPEAVGGEKDGEDMQSMDYGRITPLLVKAIQEQQEQIDALQSEINLLKGE